MSTVKIQTSDGKVSVSSPYNGDFVNRARELGGKWQNEKWNFDARDEERVRQMCLDVYGTDGSPMPSATIRVNLDKVGKMDAELVLGPVTVLRKFNRDSKPVLGPGCVVVAGGLESYGGSSKYPRITYKAGTVIEIRDIPQPIADKLTADDPDAYTLVEDESTNGNELTAEEKSLVAALQALSTDRLQMVLEQLK